MAGLGPGGRGGSVTRRYLLPQENNGSCEEVDKSMYVCVTHKEGGAFFRSPRQRRAT